MAVLRILLVILLVILLGIPLLLTLLSAFPATVYLHFDGLLKVRLRVLGIPFTLFDGSREPNQKQTRRQTGTGKGKDTQKSQGNPFKAKLASLQSALRQEGLLGYVNYCREIFGYGRKMLSGVRRAFTIHRLKLHYTVAGGEPDAIALRYGQLCGAVYTAQALLEQTVRVRSREIRLRPDFLAQDASFYVDAVIRLSPLRLLFAIGGCIFRMWGYTNQRITDYESQLDLQGG